MSKENKKIIFSLIGGLAVFLITLAVFSASLENDFVPWDDDKYVYKNSVIMSLESEGAWNIVAGMHEFNYWHPAAWLSHAVDYRIYDLDPWGHHFTSVVIHAMTTAAVYFLFVILVGAVRPEARLSVNVLVAGAFIALVFGLHPLRVEAAVWIAERKEVMSGFFYFTGLIAYLYYVNAKPTLIRALLYSGTLLLFCLGLLSKPHVVTFPVILLLLDWYPLKRLGDPGKRFKVIIEKVPFFALSLAFSVATMILQKSGVAVKTLQDVTLVQRLWNAVRSISFYIEKTLWPFPLIPYYPLEQTPSALNPAFIFSSVLILTITYVCIKFWRKGNPIFLSAWLFYLITIFPAIGLVQVGTQSGADRFSYNTTLSFYFLIGFAVIWILEKYSGSFFRTPHKQGFAAVGIFLLIGLSILSLRQMAVWKNGETLWTYVLHYHPDNLNFAFNNLGGYYHEQEKYDLAEPLFLKAISIKPDDVGARINLALNYFKQEKFKASFIEFKKVVEFEPDNYQALNKLAVIYSKHGQFEKSIKEFNKVLQLKPDSLSARNDLGLALYKANRFKEAESEILKVIERDNNYLEAHNSLGLIYRKTQRLEEAEKEFKKVLKLNPEKEAAIYNLGLVYRDRGDMKEAEKFFIKALDIAPDRVEARNDLAIIMLRGGRVKEAENQLLLALKSKPDFFDGLNNLGVAYLKTQRYQEAEEVLEKALKLQPTNKVTHSNLLTVRRQLSGIQPPQILETPPSSEISPDLF